MVTNVTNWLDDMAETVPDKTALVDAEQSITYRQYRDRSIGLAHEIIALGIGPKKPILVYLEKSVRCLTAFLGIAYSGNFYTPVAIDMPDERVKKIIEVLEPSLVITSKEYALNLDRFGYLGKRILVENISERSDSSLVQSRVASTIDMDLLYVFFTSGSTGIPKGVCITHRGVIDYIDNITSIFGISESDVFGNQAPFYFDNSILDIYSAMKNGATVYIIPSRLFSEPVRLLEYIKAHKINTIFWVPSALMVVSRLKALDLVDLRDTLQRVLFCGEVMPTKQLNIWRKHLPHVCYANLYGPTEITDACTYYIIDRDFADDEQLPIGFPMNNTEILVLDETDCIVTNQNMPGELCVRGTGVAKGYYRNPQKTARAFVQNPLNTSFEDIIYRTGDIVQYNSYNELVYLCRKDFQIKYMGHRIELGEIETAVNAMDDITMCCCLYDERKKQIVLFIDADKSREDVNAFLQTKLPSYMLPKKVLYIESFPINPNGKIDRMKLKDVL